MLTNQDGIIESLVLSELPDSNPFDELLLYTYECGVPYRAEFLGGRDETVENEFRKFIDEGKSIEDFYRESEVNLYHSIHMETDRWQAPYRQAILETLPTPRTVLDYGCGAGGNGLILAGRGYSVDFVDYAETPASKFLKWRIEKRGLTSKVYSFVDNIPEHDLVFAFDVIEHTPEPFEALKQLEELSKAVAVNLLTKIPACDSSKLQLHYPLPISQLVNYINSKKVLVWRDFNYALFAIYEG